MGGRTNGCTLYKRANRDTKIYYVDFTSLYPFVNKTSRYPVGHPEIITRDFGDLSTYFGLAKVKISPPRGLFHPVLGYRTGGKLTFPLCRACVERQQQEPCACNENERAWIGTYCTPELEKALEKGYKINKIYEVDRTVRPRISNRWAVCLVHQLIFEDQTGSKRTTGLGAD